MLDQMDAGIEQGGVVQLWKVPRVEAPDIKSGRNERMAHRMDESAHAVRARERAHDGGSQAKGKTAKERADRRSEHEQRRRDDREEHVLDHVPGERVRGLDIDRGCQRRDERSEPEEEHRRSPDGPGAPHPPKTARVQRRGDDREESRDYSRNVLSTMIATKRSARYTSE